MEEIEPILNEVISKLENQDTVREKVIHLTRKLNRVSGRGIAKLVKSNDYSSQLDEARFLISQIIEKMETIAPITSWNLTISGTEEYAEFELLHSILKGVDIPSPPDLKIPDYIWIAGLCDTIGELRRIMLNSLINMDIEYAKSCLDEINKIYSLIAGLEFSKSLVPNLRRKIDIARTLIERSESDFVNAVVNKRT